MEGLKTIFTDATITDDTEANPTVEKEGDGVNVIKTGKKKTEFDHEVLDEIYSKVAEIRNGITE